MYIKNAITIIVPHVSCFDQCCPLLYVNSDDSDDSDTSDDPDTSETPSKVSIHIVHLMLYCFAVCKHFLCATA